MLVAAMIVPSRHHDAVLGASTYARSCVPLLRSSFIVDVMFEWVVAAFCMCFLHSYMTALTSRLQGITC